MSPAPKQDCPTVQLLHELPDGSRHVDWMLAQDPRGQGPLVTFRVPRRVDELRPGEALDAVRIADHRPAYLTYEGPVSGGRGTVTRLASGRVAALDERPDGWHLEIAWEAPPRFQRLRVTRRAAGNDAWTVEALAEPSST
jgi:hypothetical protein